MHLTSQDLTMGSLRYECAETSVGRVLVLIGESGAVDAILGDSLAEMLSVALRRFPGMGMLPDRGAHAGLVASVVKRIETSLRDHDLGLSAPAEQLELAFQPTVDARTESLRPRATPLRS